MHICHGCLDWVFVELLEVTVDVLMSFLPALGTLLLQLVSSMLNMKVCPLSYCILICCVWSYAWEACSYVNRNGETVYLGEGRWGKTKNGGMGGCSQNVLRDKKVNKKKTENNK